MQKDIWYKGNKYRLVEGGYYIRTARLHRDIWQDYYGEIPKNHHIHHKNGNPCDNHIENLECIPENDHPFRHLDFEKQKRILHEGRDKAIAWHRSNEGREWHRLQGIKNWDKRGHVPQTCVMCGNKYLTKNKSRPKYCSQKCRSRAQYLRDRIIVKCVICKKEFDTFKKKQLARACSPKCGSLLTAKIKREKKFDTFPKLGQQLLPR